MDYEDGDHYTAGLGYVRLFGRKAKVPCARALN